jgi:hypothetical protein
MAILRKKKYCSECKYFCLRMTPACNHKSNAVFQDTYLERKIIQYKESPEKLNKNNNCNMYKAL